MPRKLFMQQKVWSIRDRFTITDEENEPCYEVEGEVWTLGKKLHVYDMQGTEVVYLQQKLWSFLPRFHIFRGEECVATLVKEFTFLHPRYRVEGPEWEVSGNFMAHDYEISAGEKIIAVVKKAWFTWGDFYEIDAADGVDSELVLAVVLGIDAILEQSGAAVTVSSGN